MNNKFKVLIFECKSHLTCRDYDSKTASRRLTSDFLSILTTTTITLADIVKTEAQSMTIMTTQKGSMAVAGERIEVATVVEGRAAGLEVGTRGKTKHSSSSAASSYYS